MPHDRDHNAPGLGTLSQETLASCEAGRAAIATLKKTIEQWIVIGRAIKDLREHADRLGGRQTFQRLLQREGFGNDDRGKPIIGGPAVISRLLLVMENLPAVIAWHEKLPSHQKIEWASPTSIVRHCPIFAETADTKSKPLTVGLDLRGERDMWKEKARRLEANGGNQFTGQTPARTIVEILFDTLSEPKFAEVIKLGYELQIKQNTLTREAMERVKAEIRARVLAGKAE